MTWVCVPSPDLFSGSQSHIIAEKAIAPPSSTLAWKIPRTEEPGRLQSMGSRWVRHDWATSLSLFTFMHWRRKWQPTSVLLLGDSPGTGEPGVLLSMGSHRVRHDWSDAAVAAHIIVPIIKLMSLSLYSTFLDLVSDAEVVALQIAFFFFFLPADSMMLCY